MIKQLTSDINVTHGVLAAVGDHFPQADPSQSRSGPGPARSRLGVFGLRFAQRVGAPSDGGLPPSVICPDRQIAVDPETGRSWRTLFPCVGSMKTTGQSPDGQGSTGNEEWTPDFAGDMA